MTDPQDKGRGHLGFKSGALGTLDTEPDTSEDTRNETSMERWTHHHGHVV